jgi:hypothetical protein
MLGIFENWISWDYSLNHSLNYQQHPVFLATLILESKYAVCPETRSVAREGSEIPCQPPRRYALCPAYISTWQKGKLSVHFCVEILCKGCSDYCLLEEKRKKSTRSCKLAASPRKNRRNTIFFLGSIS